MAGEVDDREQQIADFVLQPAQGTIVRHLEELRPRRAYFLQLLLDLLKDLPITRLAFGPIEADAGGFQL